MNTQLIIDPLSKYRECYHTDILNIAGFLPGWALNQDFFHLPVKQAMEEQYGFGTLSEIKDATVDDMGVMRYPGDPAQYPMFKIVRGEEVVYQYQYGMIAFVSPTETFVTRMD